MVIILQRIIFLFGALDVISIAWAQLTPTVRTSQGNIVGSVTDSGIFVFYGIPYAGNPSGANRFKSPPPAPNFPGDFHAIDSTRVCAQPSVRGLVGVEDCLVLSIYSRNLTATSPVIVFLDGEEYSSTTRGFVLSYNGLVEEGNVVVTLNYRLSVFGFLCLGIEEAPGNAGLYDVIAGLQWISQNIGGFGGNPQNVVLFGHGSGAAMADLVTLSPLSVGLVHKAIVSSGSALSPWAVSYTPIAIAKAFAATYLRHTGNTHQELAEAYVDADINVLLNMLSTYSFYNSTTPFAPCIENVELKNNGTFLPDAPINIIRSGNYRQIPYITGYANREGTIRAGKAVHDSWIDRMNTNFTDFLQVDLTFPSELNKTAVAQTIKSTYFGNNTITMANIEDFLDYFGDTMFIISIIRNAQERAATSSIPIRLYEFQYRGTQNSDWTYNIPLTGARHGSILNYIFHFDLYEGDEPVRRALLARWSAFAATGIPTPSTVYIDWPPLDANLNHLVYSGSQVSPNVFGFTENQGIRPHNEMVNFWNNIYTSHYVAPRSVSSANKVFSCSLSLIVFAVLSFVL